MKPTLNEYEKHQLEMINREIKQSDIEMKLYCWVAMPCVLALVGAMIWSLF